MSYFHQDGCTIIKKHYILFSLLFIKLSFFGIISLLIGYIGITYRTIIGEEVVIYIFFPLVLILVNYSFLKLILGLIEHFNNLFVIYNDQIFIIDASLIMKNDLEIIDTFKIVKLDAYSDGLISNILGFGEIIIENQAKEQKVFNFMPNPYKLLDILKKQRLSVLEDRKKKYVVDELTTNNKN
ncbi:MAG: hypothetical protein PHE25_02575 [Candidatus Gracilibacteria bacterium]|nr:hypothetical protein [Candidatus Gracilibacteria bacterium]